jgi:hypothetical protein
MNRAIDEADILLAVLSEAYLDPGHYSATEVSAAQALLVSSKRRLVVVSIDNTPLPPLLRSRIPINISGIPFKEATRLFVKGMLPLRDDSADYTANVDFGVIDALPPPIVSKDINGASERLASIDSEIYRETADATEKLRDIVKFDSEQLYIEQAYYEARSLGRTYLHQNPHSVFREAARLRARIETELARNRNPDQLRDLHLSLALTFGIMSYTALDLGHGASADKLANAALAHATRSGEVYARGWAFGTLSLIARFNGNSSLSAQYAEKGLELPVVGTARCRLLSNAAEAYAILGNEQSMKRFLTLSVESLDQEVPPSAPTLEDGIFYFPRARVHFYAASSLVQLPGVRSNEEAANQAELAVDLFEHSGPMVWSYNDILVAKVHLARARLQAGHVDGVLSALESVLLAPMQYRTSWHAHFLIRLNAELVAKKLSTAHDGRALATAIRAYVAESAYLLPQEDAWVRQVLIAGTDS